MTLCLSQFYFAAIVIAVKLVRKEQGEVEWPNATRGLKREVGGSSGGSTVFCPENLG